MHRSFLPVILFAASLAGAWATTLEAISEDDQIQSAQTIFRGRAEQVDAAFEQRPRGRVIVTTVRFTPLAVYKGSAPGPVSLRFLGGKVGDLEMTVGAMPRFLAGQEYVLFVSGEKNRACPVVGWSEGSLPVDRRANAAGTVSAEKTAPAESGVVARSRKVLTGPMPLPDFERRLKGRINELGASR